MWLVSVLCRYREGGCRVGGGDKQGVLFGVFHPPVAMWGSDLLFFIDDTIFCSVRRLSFRFRYAIQFSVLSYTAFTVDRLEEGPGSVFKACQRRLRRFHPTLSCTTGQRLYQFATAVRHTIRFDSIRWDADMIGFRLVINDQLYAFAFHGCLVLRAAFDHSGIFLHFIFDRRLFTFFFHLLNVSYENFRRMDLGVDLDDLQDRLRDKEVTLSDLSGTNGRVVGIDEVTQRDLRVFFMAYAYTSASNVTRTVYNDLREYTFI